MVPAPASVELSRARGASTTPGRPWLDESPPEHAASAMANATVPTWSHIRASSTFTALPLQFDDTGRPASGPIASWRVGPRQSARSQDLPAGSPEAIVIAAAGRLNGAFVPS